MTTLTAPADGALGADVATFLDGQVWFPIVVVLAFLAFAIGHVTGRVEARVRAAELRRTQPAHRRAEYARFDAEMTAQLLPACRTPAPSDDEFAEWSRRLSEALSAFDSEHSPQPLMLKSEKRMVCGLPTRTSLGAVRCLARPGHPGRC